MHWMGYLMYATVALWLAPGGIWRPVALALLTQWAVGEFIFAGLGEFVPVWAYLPFDLAIIAVVVAMRSHWSDWLVVAPYPAVWWLYAQPVSQAQWEALYWIALAQFIVAGPWPQIMRGRDHYSHGSSKRLGVQHAGGA